MFFLTYIPYFFITNQYGDMSFGQKIASCFLNNLAMAIAFQQVGTYESTGILHISAKCQPMCHLLNLMLTFNSLFVALTIELPPGNV